MMRLISMKVTIITWMGLYRLIRSYCKICFISVAEKDLDTSYYKLEKTKEIRLYQFRRI